MAYKRTSPQPVAEGGTGAQSFTSYGTLCGGTSTTNPIQSVSPSTAGQILISNGSSSLPSFQANPSSLIMLDSQTASNSADITFDNTVIDGSYAQYVLFLEHFIPTGSSTSLGIVFSTDNGSSYLTTGYASGYHNAQWNLSTVFNTASSTNIRITGGDDSTYQGTSSVITFFGLASSNVPSCLGIGTWKMTTTGLIQKTTLLGFHPTTSGVDNIKISYNTGNISTGTATWYGRVT